MGRGSREGDGSLRRKGTFRDLGREGYRSGVTTSGYSVVEWTTSSPEEWRDKSGRDSELVLGGH